MPFRQGKDLRLPDITCRALLESRTMEAVKLKALIENVERLSALARGEVKGNWNNHDLPVAFTNRKGSIDIVLRSSGEMHNQEQAVLGMIISSKATADFKGAIEVVLFQKHLPYLAGWINDIMKLREYRRIHDLLSKYLYEHSPLCFISSVIEIKQKKGQH